MTYLSDLYSDLHRYRNLRSSLNQVISNLNDVINNLEPASNNISSYYTIDDVSADLKAISSTRGSLIQKRDFLSGSVMTSIENKISGIEDDIRVEEERIEREREEEERRLKEEQERLLAEAQKLKEANAGGSSTTSSLSSPDINKSTFDRMVF